MNTKRAFQAVAAALAAVALVQAVPIPNGAEDTAALAAAAGGEDGTAFTDSFSQRFKNGFVAAFSMMIVSEIGDKTFFIAAIMAMRHNRFVIFAGAISALAVMTVLSAYAGTVFTYIPKYYTHYTVTALFFFFGIKLLREGFAMADDEGAEELEEVTQELKKSDEEMSNSGESRGWLSFSPILIQAFTLTFLAEWGDRSQIATIALGAKEDPIAVSIGAILGHACCSAMAVIGGRMLATKISVRSVTLVGAVVFILFAVANLIWPLEGTDDIELDVEAANIN